MPVFNNLPGVLVNTVDHGLVSRTPPTSKSTLILGTAGMGPANNPYTVVDQATAASAFGVSGNLVQAMEEVGAASDNMILFRIGTSPAVLSGVGATSIGTPTAPTQTSTGSPTSSTFTYSIVARNASGTTLPSAGLTVTAAGGLSISNYVTLSWTAVTGATSYDVLKISGTTAASGTGNYLLSNVTAATYADKGTTTTSYTVPTVDTSGSPGFTISLGSVSATTATDYTICYANGVVNLYFQGGIVYSNGSNPVNSGDSVVNGAATAGLTLGASPANFDNSISLTAAAAASGTSLAPAPTLTEAVTGLGMTPRQTYVALVQAFNILDSLSVDQVFVPGVYIDQPNVAYNATVDSPSTGVVLDWLNTTTSSVDGHLICQWASESTNSDGTTVTPPSFVSADDRISQGFYEVGFAYQLARFCQLQTYANSPCIGFIGVTAPTQFDIGSVRKWVGTLPTYDPVSGNPVAPGTGCCGIPVLVGTTSSNLNPLAADYINGFRLPGMYDTVNMGTDPFGEYDGIRNEDANGNLVDIGTRIHVVGECVYLNNGWGQYQNNLAGTVAGICGALDPKNALTNTVVAQVQKLSNFGLTQMDSLTQADVNVLRSKGYGQSPVLLHDKTAANSGSDYIYLSTVRIKALLEAMIRRVGGKFVGKTSSDGMQLSAMQTALNSAALELQKRGYLQSFSFTITATLAEQRLGHALVQVSFMPALELVQLTAQVGISRSSS